MVRAEDVAEVILEVTNTPEYTATLKMVKDLPLKGASAWFSDKGKGLSRISWDKPKQSWWVTDSSSLAYEEGLDPTYITTSAEVALALWLSTMMIECGYSSVDEAKFLLTFNVAIRYDRV